MSADCNEDGREGAKGGGVTLAMVRGRGSRKRVNTE